MVKILSCIVQGLGVVVVASAAHGQELRTEGKIELDRSAFSMFSEELKGLESGSFVDLPVALPVLGFPVGKPASQSGLESASPGITVDYSYDADDPVWYVQSYEDKLGYVVVEGELSALTEDERAALGLQAAYTCDEPQVLYSGGDEGSLAGLAEDQQDEVTTVCGIGNATYSVTLQCKGDFLDFCNRSDTATNLIQSLRLLDGDALKD